MLKPFRASLASSKDSPVTSGATTYLVSNQVYSFGIPSVSASISKISIALKNMFLAIGAATVPPYCSTFLAC